MIYRLIVNKVQIKQIALALNVNYSSVRTIINAYKKTGRTNKLLTSKSKESILNLRREEKILRKELAR